MDYRPKTIDQEKLEYQMAKILTTLLTFTLMASSLFAQTEDWYVIDLNGDTVSHIKAELLAQAGDDFIIIKRNGKYGLIDYKGRSILKAEYEDIKGYTEGVACIKKDGLYGYMDAKGRLVLPARYKDAFPFDKGVAAVNLPAKDRFGFIDKTGHAFVGFLYAKVSTFTEGYAWTNRMFDDFFGMIDKKGDYLLEPIYEDLHSPQEGLIAAKKLKKWGYLDLKGGTVIEHQYHTAHSFNNGVAFYSNDGQKYGLIDKQGKVILEPSYEAIKKPSFVNGLSAVKKGESWGYITPQGSVSIPFQFEDCLPFLNGKAAVKQEGRWGFINTQGTIILSPRFKSASNFFPVRQRPVAIVRGADYELPVEEAPKKEEEKAVEKPTPVVEKEPIAKKPVNPYKTYTKSRLKTVSKDPKDIANELDAAEHNFNNSRQACSKSLRLITEAEESDDLGEIYEKAPFAREGLDEAILAYNTAQNHLRGITKIANANTDCYKLVPLAKVARIRANEAGLELRTASDLLDEQLFKKFGDALTAYFDRLGKANNAANELRAEINTCLSNN